MSNFLYKENYIDVRTIWLSLIFPGGVVTMSHFKHINQ